ncbi:energy-coupling factor ABC transporter permease [Rhodoferax sp. U2-2l]|nr:energy-coupling factor ABC transporter permease [Rhodoferax sp. U2-2l]MCB8747579.1 energy-coupling factor ABC transporter permease [Rhodoferax sp. U2-2l]
MSALSINLVVLLLCLSVALLLRPWQLLKGATRLTPMLAALTLLPWLWALPSLHQMPLQLQGSGACLLVLMLGWPLAVPVLCGVGVLAALISPMGWDTALDLTVWLGLVPATLALGLGLAVRRWVGHHLFVYILGRAFLGTVVCVFAAGVLGQWAGHNLPGVDDDLSLVAHWLIAWGDAFLTGLATAILVAYKPDWLATWSDRLYLKKP